jgi:hypothetical protein
MLFHEVQYCSWWVYGLMACVLVVLLGVLVLFFRLEITIGGKDLTVRFGWLPVFQKRLPLRDIAPAEGVGFFCTYYGPTVRKVAALDAAGQTTLHRDFEQLWTDNNQARDGSTQVDAEYLAVMAIRSYTRKAPTVGQ